MVLDNDQILAELFLNFGFSASCHHVFFLEQRFITKNHAMDGLCLKGTRHPCNLWQTMAKNLKEPQGRLIYTSKMILKALDKQAKGQTEVAFSIQCQKYVLIFILQRKFRMPHKLHILFPLYKQVRELVHHLPWGQFSGSAKSPIKGTLSHKSHLHISSSWLSICSSGNLALHFCTASKEDKECIQHSKTWNAWTRVAKYLRQIIDSPDKPHMALFIARID